MTDRIISYESGAEIEGTNATTERLRYTLLTPKGSLSSDPEYGFDGAGYIDEQISVALKMKIKAEIQNIITNYFPELEILNLIIEKFDIFSMNIKLTVRVMTEGETSIIKLEFNNG